MKTYNPKSVEVWCGGVRVDDKQSFEWKATEVKSDPYIQTYSHKKLHLFNPKPEEIELEDIPHALGLKTRYTGHCKFHYSVAQHCVLGANLLEDSHGPWSALAFLLHELGEVYLPDIASPLKPHIKIEVEPGVLMGWKELERRHEVAILEALGLDLWLARLHHPIIKEMDNSMLAAEANAIMSPLIPGWGGDAMRNPAKTAIVMWEPEAAADVWLITYKYLRNIIG